MLNNLFHKISESFEGLSKSAYSKLALKFLTIPEMVEARDMHGEGISEHLSEAMIYYADQNLD